jgi:flagellar biosynthesis protein FlhF
MARQVGQLRTMVETLLARGAALAPSSPVLAKMHTHLLAHDVGPQIAADLIRELGTKLADRQLEDEQHVGRQLRELIASKIPISGEPASGEARRVMAFVGPTGVGKTTTIAKLAAGFKLSQNKRVGLITVDTYRIAAVDQLRTYAEIIEVPLMSALSPAELGRVLSQMTDVDVVLIDTTGRSPSDQIRLNQLRSFLSAAQTDEVHLVVSATETSAGARRTVEKFRPLGVNRIVLSKIDEAATFGVILNVAVSGASPLSYCTCGQEVPDDISPARADDLARLIMGEPRA